MAHYAFLDENLVVIEVITGKEEDNFNCEERYGFIRNKLCKRTSYNTRGGIYYDSNTNNPSEDQSKAYRKNYAGIGYTYDEQRDAFIPPKPYPSWILNENTCLWESPIPYPTDGNIYTWNEESLEWTPIELPT